MGKFAGGVVHKCNIDARTPPCRCKEAGLEIVLDRLDFICRKLEKKNGGMTVWGDLGVGVGVG